MNKYDVGSNAGIIWNLLAEKNGKLSLTQIKEETGFELTELMLALGWLLREGKITEFIENNEPIISLVYSDYYF